MTAQEDLGWMANQGTQSLRVRVTATALNAWSATEQRDTFRHYLVMCAVAQVGIGPVFECHEAGKNLDAVAGKVRAQLTSYLATDQSRKTKKLKLKKR